MTNIEKALTMQPTLMGEETLNKEEIKIYQCPSDYGLKDLCAGPTTERICPCEECWNQEVEE